MSKQSRYVVRRPRGLNFCRVVYKTLFNMEIFSLRLLFRTAAQLMR